MQLLFLSAALLAIGLKAPGKTAWPEQKSVTRDSSVLPAILALPLSSYIGKPVDSLLTRLPLHHSARGFMPARIRYLRGIYQLYGTNENNMVAIEIFIDEFHFLQVPCSADLPPWDMNLAKKEKIAFIKVFKNNITCIYGCDNPNYDY